ncbi:VNG_1110C family protein [Haloarchaeobius sp. HRN-SO-5]|uniref:VNG_1110C family protein n=1 Tax=Haloarchaeobius sp. HRN-SO-5 TaxID=3446118 RepID=UPI003EBAE460
MPAPSQLRDSTQIVLPEGTAAELRQQLDDEFTLSILDEGETCRLVGSPVEIKRVSNYLARQGVPMR